MQKKGSLIAQTNRFTTIIRNIPKCTLEELRYIKKAAEAEIHKKNAQNENGAKRTRLYHVLRGIFRYDNPKDDLNYEDALIKMTQYTRDQFAKYRNIGAGTLEFAETELHQRGLAFKADDNTKD